MIHSGMSRRKLHITAGSQTVPCMLCASCPTKSKIQTEKFRSVNVVWNAFWHKLMVFPQCERSAGNNNMVSTWKLFLFKIPHCFNDLASKLVTVLLLQCHQLTAGQQQWHQSRRQSPRSFWILVFGSILSYR